MKVKFVYKHDVLLLEGSRIIFSTHIHGNIFVSVSWSPKIERTWIVRVVQINVDTDGYPIHEIVELRILGSEKLALKVTQEYVDNIIFYALKYS